MEKTRPTRESDKIMLRVPDGMRGRIKALAKTNQRSMNSEIISLLDWALEKKYGEEANALSVQTIPTQSAMGKLLMDEPDILESIRAVVREELDKSK